MTKISFVHCHNHSCHSERDAFSKVSDIARKVSESGMKAFALTDHGVMHGVPEAFKEAKKHGIKAIAGCEVYETDDRSEKGKHYHMIMLAQNKTGYHNLVKIVSDAFMNGFYGKPRTDWEMIRKHSEGVIVTSACLAARIPQHLMAGEYDKAKEYALEYKSIFGENFYLEIQANTIPEQHMVNQQLIKLSEETGIEMIATVDAHYLDKSDAENHQGMLCLGRQKRMITEETPSYGGEDTYYLMTPKEVFLAFSKQGIDRDVIIKAMNNTGKIADSVTFVLEKERDLLPELEGVENLDDELNRAVSEGFKRKLGPIVKTSRQKFDEYRKRASYELKVIKEKGYSDYFLIVSDFLQYAKSINVVVGPGRGSSAGSLVGYLLDITEVDPIEHGLYFERFLDVTRSKLPDIDVDIEDVRRNEIYEYLKGKYGAERVAKVGTTGRMTARKAFKNALRVWDVPFKDAQDISAMIPDELGITIDRAYKLNPELKRMRKKRIKRADGQIVELEKVFSMAEAFEFVVDQHGTHAAGVLITPGPITDFFPVRGNKELMITHYDKIEIEELGGVKFDLLGLKTLNTMGMALRSIKAETGESIDINEVMRTANDPKVYQLISRGETSDLFQINSEGMQSLCKRVKPKEFKDVVAITALYRPPALASGDTWRFADIKDGKEPIHFSHPEEERITGETYGVITYQEHVMELVHHFAGWDYGVGDKLRKMKTEELESMRDKFIADASKYDPEAMDEIWSRIVRYMGYGFNKAHGVAYTMITYATAWLKVNYPEHWLAAQMSVNMGEHEKIAKAFVDVKSKGFDFIPPDVSLSDKFFTASDKKIVFPIGTIKGVGDKAAEELIKNKPFDSLEDLMKRCELRIVSKRAMIPIILSGGLDRMYPDLNRAEIVHKYLVLKKDPAKVRDEWEAKAQVWSDDDSAEMEKELLGIYVTNHPLERYGFRNFFTEVAEGKTALVGGSVTAIKTIIDRKGGKMAFVTIETLHGPIEITVFSSTYKTGQVFLKKNKLVMISGKKEGNKMLANKIEELL